MSVTYRRTVHLTSMPGKADELHHIRAQGSALSL